MARVWERPTGGPSLGPRTVIHIADALPAVLTSNGDEVSISLVPLVSDECDLSVLVFTLPPNYVGKVHWHPSDTVYVIRRGQMIVDGEGTYEVGDVRWVKSGTIYGPEGAGPDGCDVMLIAAGSFPLPTYGADVEPPAATRSERPSG